jgi:hypothetical protein
VPASTAGWPKILSLLRKYSFRFRKDFCLFKKNFAQVLAQKRKEDETFFSVFDHLEKFFT